LHPFKDVPAKTSRVVLGAIPLAAGSGFLSVALPVFLPLEGMSVTNLGAILTTAGLATVIFSVPFAILSDRYGRKLLMTVGSGMSVLILLVPGFTSNFFILEASAVFLGMGEAMYLSTWNAYLADTTTREARAATFSLSFVVFTIASGAGSLLPGLFPFTQLTLLDAHRVAFVILGLLGLATPVSVARWAADMKPKSSHRSLLPRKSAGVIAKFSTANMMIGLGAGLIIPLIPTWFYMRFNETDVFSGPLLAVSNLAMGLAAVVSPNIAKRIGLVRGIVTTEALATLFLFIMPFTPTAAVAAPLYVVRAMLMNMSSPLSDTFLMSMIAEDERATASSFNSVIWRLPNAASTVVGGSLLNSGELSFPFYLCTTLYVSSITLFYALFRHAEREDDT